jgi:hypothetical protein
MASEGNFFAGIVGAGIHNTRLLKVNASGGIVWDRTYRSNSWTMAAATMPNGNAVVAGSIVDYGCSLMGIGPNGDSLWAKGIATPSNIYGETIANCSDGNFIMASFMPPYGNGIWLLKSKPNGDTLWTKTYHTAGSDLENSQLANFITQTPNGNLFVTRTLISSVPDTTMYLLSIIDDRYAYKSTPFFFKIPVSGDSLSHGYTPLTIPSGMTVSPGGTISWTSTSDSSYMDHVEFIVSDDFGNKDTLTFNIFVNSKDHPNKTVDPISRSSTSSPNSFTVHPLSSKEVRFSLPAGTSSLRVYDMHGQLLEDLSVRGNQAIWLPKHSSGRYFAKAIYERSETVKGFTVVK